MTESNQPSQPLRVFLCHSSGDKPAVRELYRLLREGNFEPWLDEVNLLPGQDFRYEITKAVRESDAVVVCLSRGSINKEGFVQKEIVQALDVAEEKPQGTIFIIPLRLDECDVPQRLSYLQRVDLFEKEGYEKLVRSLEKRAESLEKNRKSPKDTPPGGPSRRLILITTVGFLIVVALTLLYFNSSQNPATFPAENQNRTRPSPQPTMRIEPLN